MIRNRYVKQRTIIYRFDLGTQGDTYLSGVDQQEGIYREPAQRGPVSGDAYFGSATERKSDKRFQG